MGTHLYATTHRVQLISETFLNKQRLQGKCIGDSILGFKQHTKGTEPFFPEFSYTDGNKYKYKKRETKVRENDGSETTSDSDDQSDENNKKKDEYDDGRVSQNGCTESCILANSS